jgi:CelD/BcsL family acetyltransferase involved in cellulose biosynthesis
MAFEQCIQPIGVIPGMEAAPAVDCALDAPLREESRYRVEVLADAAALMQLKPQWDALCERAGIDLLFLTHEWISSWWEGFGAGKSLHILLVKDGLRLVGIAPLQRVDRKLCGMRVRCLAALCNPHTPRFDFIVDPAESAEVYRRIWNHLRADAGWDCLELAQLRADSPTLSSMGELARKDGCATGVWHGEQSPYLPLTGTFKKYFSGLGSKHRGQVHRKWNRLCERGAVRLEQIDSPERIESALDEGFCIEAAAWKAQTGTAVRSAPDAEKFYRMFAHRAAAMGALRLMFLTLDGKRIAFAYGLCYRNRFYVLKAGYDPEYSYYSPCNLLCYLQLQDGFARGLEEYDFIGNNESWKLAWTRLVRRHDWLYIFRPRPRARLIRLVKFRWIPLLQRLSVYRRLRDILFPKGKACLRGGN